MSSRDIFCAAEEPNGRNDVEVRDGDLRYCVLIGSFLLSNNTIIDLAGTDGQGVSFTGNQLAELE